MNLIGHLRVRPEWITDDADDILRVMENMVSEAEKVQKTFKKCTEQNTKMKELSFTAESLSSLPEASRCGDPDAEEAACFLPALQQRCGSLGLLHGYTRKEMATKLLFNIWLLLLSGF